MRHLVAESEKLATLPLARAAAIGTVVLAAVLTVALASSGDTESAATGARTLGLADAVRETWTFVQCGTVVLGVAAVCHEYEGRQIVTTLTAMPGRLRLFVAKALVVALAAVLTSAASLAAVAVTLAAAQAGRAAPVDFDAEAGLLLGAWCYLVLMTLFGSAVGALVRNQSAALATVLGLVLVVSPLLRMTTERARWLPDLAARQLFDHTDTVLTPLGGATVALTWTLALGALAAARLTRGDA